MVVINVGDQSPPPSSTAVTFNGLPGDVFSTDIMRNQGDQRQQRKANRNGQFFKYFSIVSALLSVALLIAVILLAFILLSNLHDHGLGEHKPIIGGADGFNLSSITTNNNHDNYNPLMMDGVGVGDNITHHLNWPPPSGSLHATFKRAAVATDNGLCSEIGRDVLLEGGNAVDATIASLFCVGVVNPQSSGIGGGFLMTLYNVTTQRCMSIDAREVAPLSATSTMYAKHPNGSLNGYTAIATPGELHGLWTIYTHFASGRISWRRLLQPSIRLAREGFPVSSNLALVLQQKEDQIDANAEMKHTFVDPRSGRPYEEGDIMKRERLAELLKELADADNPVELFYKGGIAETITSEVKDNGGYLTMEDLAAYETIIYESPLESEVLPEELIMCGPPPPSSSAVVQAIVGVMAQFYPDKHTIDLDDPLIYHRLIESEKFSYAQRTKLGDIAFVKNARSVSRNMTKTGFAKWIASLIKDEAQPINYYTRDLTGHVPDHGTSHVTALDHEGNAVSVTSTVNQLLGAKVLSHTLGFVWNDEMDDFSMPNVSNAFGFAPSPENFILPRKRPMSSMSPIIIYNRNSGKVRMVIGASGGSRIISAVAQTIIRALLFNQTVKEAVDAPRLHNQFLPHSTEYEHTVPLPIVKNLVKKHNQNMTAIEKQPSVVQALLVGDDGFVHGNSDFRRKTSTYPSGF